MNLVLFIFAFAILSHIIWTIRQSLRNGFTESVNLKGEKGFKPRSVCLEVRCSFQWSWFSCQNSRVLEKPGTYCLLSTSERRLTCVVQGELALEFFLLVCLLKLTMVSHSREQPWWPAPTTAPSPLPGVTAGCRHGPCRYHVVKNTPLLKNCI